MKYFILNVPSIHYVAEYHWTFSFPILSNFSRLSQNSDCYPFLKVYPHSPPVLEWVSSICKSSPRCSLIEPQTLSFLSPPTKIFRTSKPLTIKPKRWQTETGMTDEKIIIHLVRNCHDSQGGGDTCLDHDGWISFGNSQFVSKFPGVKSVWISVK